MVLLLMLKKCLLLGNATALDCANYTVTLFLDLTKRVTLQNLYNDGGFSNVGVSQEIIDIVSSTNKVSIF